MMTRTEDRAQVAKKTYKAPAVRRVRLVVQNSVLATCHASPTNIPRNAPTPGAGCGITITCFNKSV
jgi:hypothetical protein